MGDTINFEVNFNAQHSFVVLPSQTFPHPAPFGSFLLTNLLLIPIGEHILFKGIDEDILIKYSGMSNLEERANKINDKIISAIESNTMTF